MEMGMLFICQQPRARDHQDRRDHEQQRDGISEDNEGEQYTGERSRAVQRARACRAQSAHGVNEEHGAESIADEAEQENAQDRDKSRGPFTQQKAEQKREGPRDKSLPRDDCQRVLGGDVAGEVVVHTPEYTGKDDAQRAEGKAKSALEVRGKKNAGERDGKDRDQGAATERFAEEKQCNQGRSHALKVQQQGSCGGRCVLQTEHENDRCENAA